MRCHALIIALILFSNHADAQNRTRSKAAAEPCISKYKILAEKGSRVGKGLVFDLSQCALNKLYREARIEPAVQYAIYKRHATVFLTQDYLVFDRDGYNLSQWHREVVLNESASFGSPRDTECAVKIQQETSLAWNGDLLNSLTHRIEIPHCALQPQASMSDGSVAKQVSEKVKPLMTPEVEVDSKSPAAQKRDPVPSHSPVVDQQEKPCSEVRAMTLREKIQNDVELIRLKKELELVRQKNTNRAGRVRTESEKKIAVAFSRYPKLSESLNQIIKQVYDTRQCPKDQSKRWKEFKSVATDLYYKGAHRGLNMAEVLSAEGKPVFFCGYQDNFKRWISGNTSAQSGQLTESWDASDSHAALKLEYVQAERGVWLNTTSTEQVSSYRKSLELPRKTWPDTSEGDDVYFEIAEGVYLDATGFTRSSEDFFVSGFYSTTLLFTEKAFLANHAPEIEITPSDLREVELMEQIENKLTQIEGSIPPCDESAPQAAPFTFKIDASTNLKGEDSSWLNEDEAFLIRKHAHREDFIFGHVSEKKVAFLLSATEPMFRHLTSVRNSLVRTIIDLRSDQAFSVSFVMSSIESFNGGKMVPATRENKLKAIKFINTYAERYGNNREPFKRALDKIIDQNGKPERVYIATSAAGRNDDYQEAVQFADEMKIPVTKIER